MSKLTKGIGVWQYIKHERSCPVNEMIVRLSPAELFTGS